METTAAAETIIKMLSPFSIDVKKIILDYLKKEVTKTYVKTVTRKTKKQSFEEVLNDFCNSQIYNEEETQNQIQELRESRYFDPERQKMFENESTQMV